jgi:hypothetical protein
MKKTLIPIMILLFCFALKAESQITTIDLLVAPKSEITTLSEIATDVKYIPLQTNENSLIKYVYDFMPCNNKLYIYALSSILCFDNSGKYLYKLDKQGRGPEEYTYISDWDLSPANSLLIILVPNKILLYNITDRGFVYSKALNIKGQPRNIDFGPDQKSILLSFGSSQGDEPFRNVLINLAGDTLKAIPNSYKYVKNTKMMFMAKYENLIFKNNNSLYFKFWLSDTVFALDRSGKISPSMKMDSHGKLCTTQALADFNEETMSKYLAITSIFETQKYLIYRSSKYTIYDKVTKQPSFVETKSLKDTKWLIDDITGGVNIEPKFCVDGILYSWVDALTFKKYVASDAFKTSVVKFPEKKKAIQSLADSLDETDNPVLIMITPKK